jgi:hypothetical protein
MHRSIHRSAMCGFEASTGRAMFARLQHRSTASPDGLEGYYGG